MKGKMYRLTGTGLFGKHSKGKFGGNDIPRSKGNEKRPVGKKSPSSALPVPGAYRAKDPVGGK